MANQRLNFSIGSVVDPTAGAQQALTAARTTLSDMMNRRAKEEELARQIARQKVQDDRQAVQDDRATSEYKYTLDQRTKTEAENVKKQNYLAAVANPGERITDSVVRGQLSSPEVMGQVIANNPALLKAVNEGLESLTPDEKIQYDAHFDMMAKVGNSPTQKIGALDAAVMYGGLGGEYGRTQAVEAQQALELAKNKEQADLNKQDTEITIEQLKAQKAAGKDSSSKGTTKNLEGTKLLSEAEVIAQASKQFRDDYGFGDKKIALPEPVRENIALFAKSHFAPGQITEMLNAKAKGYKGPSEGWLGFFQDPAKFTTPSSKEAIEYAGQPGNVGVSTGYSATDKKYDEKIAAVSRKHLDDARKKIENRDGVDMPTRELFNSILNNTYGDVTDSKVPSKMEQKAQDGVTGTGTSTTAVGGKIGEAINTKGKGGELATFKLTDPKGYAKEYELLKLAQKVIADKVLSSEISQKVLQNAEDSTYKTGISLRDALSTSKPLAAFPTESRLSPGALDILRQLNPTGMTDEEKMMAQFEAEDRPLEDMSLSLIPGLKAAKTTASQLKILTKAGYTKAQREALIKSGRLKLLPERPSQINVPKNGFTRDNLKYDISVPAMKP